MHGSATFWLTLGGLLVILFLVLLVFGPSRVDRFFNEHQWAGPLIVLVVTLAVVFQVQGFAGSLHESQVEACQRSNPEKAGELRNLENDAADIETDIAFALDQAPPSGERAHYVATKERHLRRKHKAIASKVEARAKYAVEPGSVVIDCHEAYPG